MSSSQVSSSAIPLSGRVALVTGASPSNGIGFAVARRLGQMGARLFLHGWPFTQDARYVDDGGVVGRGVVDLLRADGITAEYTEHDFMAPAGPETVVQEAVDAFGHLDIVDANHA